MGLWKALVAALWLDLATVTELLTERRAVVRVRPFVSSVLSAMARMVSGSPWSRLRGLLFRRVQDGQNPRRLFSIPIFQRRDGATIRLGAVCSVGVHGEEAEAAGDTTAQPPDASQKTAAESVLFCVKDILVSQDLTQVFACLVPVVEHPTNDQLYRVDPEEELMLNINAVCLEEEQVSVAVAQEGMARIAEQLNSYPLHIQRVVRKHQLASCLRREIQRFLGGFAMAKRWSLGCVDWRLDTGILGLEQETGFAIDFHMEKFVHTTAHIDLLLGEGWDVRGISGIGGYRAVLTLELWVDANQELRAQAHAILCSGHLEPASHRVNTLQDLRSAQLPGSSQATSNNITLNTLSKESSAQLLGTGKSLAWDEFQNNQDGLNTPESSPGRDGGTAAATVTTERGLETSLFHTTSTSTAAAASLRELLERTSLNWENNYLCSPIVQEAGSTVRRTVLRPHSLIVEERLVETGNYESLHAIGDLGKGIISTDVLKPRRKSSTPRDEQAETQFESFNSEEATQPVTKMEVSPDTSLGGGSAGKELASSLSGEVAGVDPPAHNQENMEQKPNDPASPLAIRTEKDLLTSILEEKECLDNTTLLDNAAHPTTITDLPDVMAHVKVENYLLQLSSLPLDTLVTSPEPTKEEKEKESDVCRSPVSPEPISVSGGPKTAAVRHQSSASEDNTSVCSSRVSRMSDLSHLTGRFSQGGAFYGALMPSAAAAPVCPFPEEWQYNTIPEVIENDDDID